MIVVLIAECFAAVDPACRVSCDVTCVFTDHNQMSHGALDDRKTLGPIGTERASRRPANMAASMYPTDINMAAVGGAGTLPADAWNLYTDGWSYCFISLAFSRACI